MRVAPVPPPTSIRIETEGKTVVNRIAAACFMAVAASCAQAQDGREIMFSSADGTTVYADVYETGAPKSAPVLSLIHI